VHRLLNARHQILHVVARADELLPRDANRVHVDVGARKLFVVDQRLFECCMHALL
jgi:hypothetical protein